MLDIESANVDASTVDGSIEYDGTIRTAGYRLTTHDGSVTVSVPGGPTSRSGRHVQRQLRLVLPPHSEKQDEAPLHLYLGSGSARLELESFDGSVNLCRPGQIHQPED
jgi:hypothetical protein